ncbi:MAG: hypothetical protein KatS3mg026_1101 [Bacteroidia bacterium]|nr:MAG: hypothetical protein KatS3mg026_1101 [Bacteroidia bacterium]
MAAALSSGLLSAGLAPLKRQRRLLYGLIFLARPVNLVLMGLTSGCTYGLLLREAPTLTLYAERWIQMLLSTVGIAAGGYWLNALYDRAIDRINRPLRARWVALVGVRRLLTATLVIWAASLLLCVGLPWKVSLLHLAALVALAWYARWGKKTGLPGNALVATLTGLVPWEVMLLTRTTTYAADWLIPLAIVFNFARELVKDAEDLPGDRLYGVRSLPTQLSPPSLESPPAQRMGTFAGSGRASFPCARRTLGQMGLGIPPAGQRSRGSSPALGAVGRLPSSKPSPQDRHGRRPHSGMGLVKIPPSLVHS